MSSVSQAAVASVGSEVAGPSHDILVQRAKEIAQMARAVGGEVDAAGTVSADVIQALYDADLMRMMQPTEYGGLGRKWVELVEIIYTLAQGCASTGWVFCVLAGHSGAMSEFPKQALEDVWGADSQVLVSSAYAPTGQLIPVDGGYRLSGRFPFSSGSDYAQWAVVGAIGLSEGGVPTPLICLVPRTDLGIVDDWDVVGLKATGSKSLTADDIFVPAHRVVPTPPIIEGSVGPYTLQSIIVGAARGGVDQFIEDIRVKPGKFGGPPPAKSQMYQLAAGEAMGEVNAAWRLLRDAVDELETWIATGRPVPKELTIANRANQALVTRLSVSAMDRVYTLAGGHAIYKSPLSRMQRDVRAGAQHMALNSNVAASHAGEMILDA